MRHFIAAEMLWPANPHVRKRVCLVQMQTSVTSMNRITIMISVKNKSVTSTYVTEAADKANTSFSNM